MASEPDEPNKPDLIVRADNLPATAIDLMSIVAQDERVFDRGGPVKVARSTGEDPPHALRLTSEQIVNLAHELARPVKLRTTLRPITLPERVARLALARDDWPLRPLKGVTTAPLLSADGSVRFIEGYDQTTGMWCCNIPAIKIQIVPTRADAEAAFMLIRRAFRTFPFADARTISASNGIPAVDLTSPPGLDESAFMVALLTAVCRPSMPLAPGLLISAPSISGAGAGKGLLVRAICAIAFGYSPFALNSCGDVKELEKRVAAALIAAGPALFIDNVNEAALRCDLLASTLTEPRVQVRMLGASRLLPGNPTIFVAVTGNAVTLSEDLVRRFLVLELDPRTENPESRSFEPGFLKSIADRRAELLRAALTIWKWGRLNEHAIPRGRPLGSYEVWGQWVRDPLVALGCADPVERIAQTKARDPERQRKIAIFDAWREDHGDKAVTVAQLTERVGKLIDPHGKYRQHLAAAVSRLAGTRVGGYTLNKHEPQVKSDPATYSLQRDEAHKIERPMVPMVPMHSGSSPRTDLNDITKSNPGGVKTIGSIGIIGIAGAPNEIPQLPPWHLGSVE